jgi:hypothetical protein
VDDGDGTATGERGSAGTIMWSTAGGAAAAGGATAMEGTGRTGTGDDIGGWIHEVWWGTMAKVRGATL